MTARRDCRLARPERHRAFDIVEDFTPIVNHSEGKQTKGAIEKAMNSYTKILKS
jgi:hypothetical protein